MFCMVFSALLAPTVPLFLAWLRDAHQAVAGASLQHSLYAQAQLELFAQRPPWFEPPSDHPLAHELATIARHRNTVHTRMDEMERLLDQIKAEGALTVAPKGSITI